jgi:hypothetical protein
LRSDASAFDADSIRILSDALEDAWQSLQTTGSAFHFDVQAEHTREILARRIIELAKLGQRIIAGYGTRPLLALPRQIRRARN